MEGNNELTRGEYIYLFKENKYSELICRYYYEIGKHKTPELLLMSALASLSTEQVKQMLDRVYEYYNIKFNTMKVYSANNEFRY